MNFYEQLEKGRYGSFELKKQVGPNLLKGFVFSLLLLSTFAASPLILNLLRGDQPPKTPDDIVYSGVPELVPFNPIRPEKPYGRPNFNPDPPKNFIPDPVDPSEIDTMIMNLPLDPSPGVHGKGDTTESGGVGNGSGGIDTNRYTGLVLPGDYIPPDTEFIAREIEPVPLDINPQPAYPSLAVTSGLGGKVTVNVYVDMYGNVKKWKIMKATPSDLGFDEEVLKVVPRWKFTPAVQSGKAVGVWVAIPFKFTLKR